MRVKIVYYRLTAFEFIRKILKDVKICPDVTELSQRLENPHRAVKLFS